MEDKDKKISVEQLKSVLVIVSMALLTIQHGVGAREIISVNSTL